MYWFPPSVSVSFPTRSMPTNSNGSVTWKKEKSISLKVDDMHFLYLYRMVFFLLFEVDPLALALWTLSILTRPTAFQTYCQCVIMNVKSTIECIQNQQYFNYTHDTSLCSTFARPKVTSYYGTVFFFIYSATMKLLKELVGFLCSRNDLSKGFCLVFFCTCRYSTDLHLVFECHSI